MIEYPLSLFVITPTVSWGETVFDNYPFCEESTQLSTVSNFIINWNEFIFTLIKLSVIKKNDFVL